jgi:FtsP/CotA-like multicopper oxidase with cupredoxin domain
VLRAGTLLAAGGSALAGTGALTGCGGMSLTGVQEVAFENPLVVPPLAESTVDAGVRRFHLAAHEGETTFPGHENPTTTWGYSGAFLGPTLRARAGESVEVHVDNALGEDTSVHWHGMHLPAAMDGGPHQMIAAGGSWVPSFEIDQPAATLWYHPHPHGQTERHVYQGLAGLFLLDDEASDAAPLPREYGVDDLPIILQDRSFDADDQFELRDDGSEPGMLGDTVMINGVVGPYARVETERVRLRVLNGSTARTYTLQMADARALVLVAVDGGLLAEPVELDRIRLAPGERAELVVGVEAGETLMLRSIPSEMGSIAAPATTGANDEFDLLELRVDDELRESPEPEWTAKDGIGAQNLVFDLDEAEAAATRSFELEDRQINGEQMDMDRIDEVVQVDTTEIWEVRSVDLLPHSFHVHDVQFRVLDVDGEEPPAELRGPKDTIYLEPRRRYRLLLAFERYADPQMPYMYHCHMLLHEDGGMMGQFVVIEPGQEDVVGIDGEVGGIADGDHAGHH